MFESKTIWKSSCQYSKMWQYIVGCSLGCKPCNSSQTHGQCRRWSRVALWWWGSENLL